MKLQVALDVETIEKALQILEETHEYVDIAEAGTVCMYYGLYAVTKIKEAFPGLEVVADLKLPDGGMECAEAAFSRRGLCNSNGRCRRYHDSGYGKSCKKCG